MGQNQVYFSLTAPMSGTIRVHETDRLFRDITVGKRVRVFYRGLWVGAFDVERVDMEETDQGLVKTVRGRGPMAWLEKALVWHDGTGSSEREFTGTYADILLTLINEAKTRGALPDYLQPTFSGTADTEGKSISGSTVTLRLQVGSTILDYVRMMWERGIWVRARWDFEAGKVLLDWIEPPYGRDLTGNVRFQPGQTITLERRSQETTDQATVFLVRSGDAFLEVRDDSAIATWGRKEDLFYADQAKINTEAASLAQDALATRKEPRLSIELSVYDHDDGPRVFVDYDLADVISVWNEHDQAWEAYRIVGFYVDFDDAGRGVVRMELNQEPRDFEMAQARLVAKTTRGKKHELARQRDVRAETETHNADSLAHRNLTLGDTGGDVTGTVSQATVVGLQGRPVADIAPSIGQVLKWDGTRWAPQNESGGGGGGSGILDGLLLGRSVVIPSMSQGWAWFRQVNGTIQETSRGLELYHPQSSDYGLVGIYLPYPSPPFVATALLVYDIVNAEDYTGGGIGVRDNASGKSLIFRLTTIENRVNVYRMNSDTSYNSTPAFHNVGSLFVTHWIQIEDDGVNISWRYSWTGTRWITLYTHPRTDFLTPQQLILYIGPRKPSDIQVTLASWEVL